MLLVGLEKAWFEECQVRADREYLVVSAAGSLFPVPGKSHRVVGQWAWFG